MSEDDKRRNAIEAFDREEAIAELKRMLSQIDELEADWLSLPEEKRLAPPELAEFFKSLKH